MLRRVESPHHTPRLGEWLAMICSDLRRWAAPYRTEVDELPLFLAIKAPGFGQVVKLECDPARGKARFIRSDPAINKKGDAQAFTARYDAERNAAVGAGPAAQPAQDDAVAQLERIAKLRDSGALTDEEFELQKWHILQSS
jgi:hypothetical protein